MDSITIYERLQGGTVLGPLDVSSLKPVVTVDAAAMARAVEQLWGVVSEQREMMVLMEKEASRKRTEQDVKISNLQSDVESRINQEARKRQQEDDKLRADLQKTRDELSALLNSIKSDMGNLEGNVSSSLEATIAQIKLALSQAHQKVTDVTERVSVLEEGAITTTSTLTDLSRKVDFEVDRLDKMLLNIHHVWNVTPVDVADAVRDKRGTEMLLETPPFAAVRGRCSAAEDRIAAVRRDLGATNISVSDLDKRVGANETEVFKLRGVGDRIASLEVELRKLVDLETTKLREMIEALGNKSNHSAVQHVAAGADTAALEDALNRALSMLAGLDERVTTVEELLKGKADLSALDGYAKLSDLGNLEDRLRQWISSSLRDGKAAPAQPQQPQQPRDSAASGALLALKDTVDGLARRLGTLEREWAIGKEAFATRDDLRDACHETLKAAERAINHIYDELRRLIGKHNAAPPGGAKNDSTAGRFRCLSCNRDAGPLSEALRERLSKSQFPPSTTLMGREARDSPPRTGAAGRTHVPGAKEGQPMTSSRRKLQNYYDWLHTKEGDEGAEQHIGVTAGAGPRERSPPKTTWLGAQSGGGGPGRQSGDHGSNDPDGIGEDGKYYTGVVSRPGSSAGQRPTSAMSGGSHRPKSAPMRREDQRAANATADAPAAAA